MQSPITEFRVLKRILKPFIKHPYVIRFLSWIIAQYIKFVFYTTRWEREGWEYPQKYWQNNQPFITCFWHNRLLMTCFAWQSSQKFHMLISSHADGQLIAQTVGHHGIQTIAGSSSKGGTTALRSIIKILKDGESIGITPDGPRGPRFKASEGIAAIAKLAHKDILPVTFSVSNRKILKSWDHFVLALPFGKGTIIWGKPIPYSESADLKASELSLMVEEALQKICDRADAYCGHVPLR